MFLNAEGAPQFATVEARRMCELWNHGLKDVNPQNGQDLRLPSGVGSLLRAAFNHGWDVCKTGVRVHHPSVPELTVTIQTGGSGSVPDMRSRAGCLLTFCAGVAIADTEADCEAQRTLRRLTPGERRVALLVAEGLSNENIAQRLQRSRRTVEYQINAIFRKLDMTRRTQLVRVLV
ncbi:MAG: LuxR C-terminal-related transcriptional regulator [Gammaproteobacteria bacterium]